MTKELKETSTEQVKAEVFKFIRSGSHLPEKHLAIMEIGAAWAFQYLEQN